MKTKRIVIGTLAGGVSMFLLGWLIYGILLMSFMDENANQGYMRAEEDMIWWAMIASNLAWGLILTLVLEWSNVFTPGRAAKTGAIFGFLAGLGFDLGMHSMTTMFDTNVSFIIIDCIAYAGLFAATGAITAWVMRKVSEAKP